MSRVRVLPADVYDALELSALAYGGIGAMVWADVEGNPCCIIGHAAAVLGREPFDGVGCPNNELSAVLALHGIGIHESDDAVRALQRRRGRKGRVPFSAWCDALNVTRGT